LCAAKNKLPEADINYQKSLAYYLKAFAIIKKLGYKHGVAYYSKEVGKAYLKLGKLKDAESYLLHAATGFEEIGYKEGAKESYELLSEVTLKEKDYNKALEYYKDFSRLKDSLLNEESVKQLTETEIKFETEKKDNEILLLNKDKQIEQSKIEQQSRNVFLIALVAALLIVSILIYVKFERNKTSLHLKELQQRALRAQLNPHFIFNVMQSIKNEYTLNAEKGEELLVNFSALIREVLDKSFLSEGTLQDEIDLVNKYITVESQHTAFNLRFTLQMDDSINASQVAFPSLALQPIIENAVRYGAACNDIVLTIKRKDNLLIIAVENDLPGDSYFNASNTNRSSTGLHLTEERINLFNKKYKSKEVWSL
jgi:sensor histidine kinase YesM